MTAPTEPRSFHDYFVNPAHNPFGVGTAVQNPKLLSVFHQWRDDDTPLDGAGFFFSVVTNHFEAGPVGGIGIFVADAAIASNISVGTFTNYPISYPISLTNLVGLSDISLDWSYV